MQKHLRPNILFRLCQKRLGKQLYGTLLQTLSNANRHQPFGIIIMYLPSRRVGSAAKHYLFSCSEYWQHVLYPNSLSSLSLLSPYSHSLKCSQHVVCCSSSKNKFKRINQKLSESILPENNLKAVTFNYSFMSQMISSMIVNTNDHI